MRRSRDSARIDAGRRRTRLPSGSLGRRTCWTWSWTGTGTARSWGTRRTGRHIRRRHGQIQVSHAPGDYILITRRVGVLGGAAGLRLAPFLGCGGAEGMIVFPDVHRDGRLLLAGLRVVDRLALEELPDHGIDL